MVVSTHAKDKRAMILEEIALLASASAQSQYEDKVPHAFVAARVVDARSGAPIARVQIIAGTAYDGKLYRTRSDGTFSIPRRSRLDVAILEMAPVGDNLFISAAGYRSIHIQLREIPPTGRAPRQELGTIRLCPYRDEII